MKQQNKSPYLLTTVTIAILLTFSKSVAAFTWKIDPCATIDFSSPPISEVVGTTRKLLGFKMISLNNANCSVPHRVGIALPWLWTSSLTTTPPRITMEWSNSEDSWITNDYPTGRTLQVTLDNWSEQLRMGEIADETGQVQSPLTKLTLPAVGSVPQTRQLDDAIPFLDLKIFTPGEAKLFNVELTYNFADGNQNPNPIVPVTLNFATVTPTSIAEPSSVLGILSLGLGWLVLLKRR